MRNIIVIGGGFAGVAAIKSLERHLPADWQPILVSEENYINFTPMLSEVVSASLSPKHTVAPLRKILHRTLFYRAKVMDIDLEQRMITYLSGTRHSLPYDHLVFACGNTPNMAFIEGMAEHALPLKTLGDALYMRNRVLVSLEQAEIEQDQDIRQRLLTFVIIGGGSSGVETAGAIADLLHAASRYYPCTKAVPYKVILLEGGDRLLSEFPEPLGDYARRIMSRDGIEIHLNTRASSITKHGVRTQNGDWIEAGNIITTIGSVSNPLIQRLPVEKERGRLVTQPDMSINEMKNVWAVGDCARIINARTGKPCSPTAQYAKHQGKQVANNILRTINKQQTHAFSYRSRGQLATIGHYRAVGYIFGVRLSGFPMWLLWRAVYLLMLPTLLRKIQVFIEWNLELLFPRDITQLHLARTHARTSRKIATPSQQADIKRKSAVSH